MNIRFAYLIALALVCVLAESVRAQVGFVPPPPVVPPVFVPPPPIVPIVPLPPVSPPIYPPPGATGEGGRAAPDKPNEAAKGVAPAAAPGYWDGAVCWLAPSLIVVAIGLYVLAVIRARRARVRGGAAAADPFWRPAADLIHGASQTGFKAIRCELILERLAASDPSVEPDRLTAWVEDTFLRAQRAWEARDYAPVRERLAPALYREHLSQLRTLRSYREINRLDGLRVDRIEFVHLDYSFTERRIAVLITFWAASYWVHDRTGAWTRGPREMRQFQQYWIFRWQKGTWVLEAIEQTRQSDWLARDNFVEFPAPTFG